MNTVKKLIIHHTGGTDLNPLADSSNQTFKVVNDYHRQKWNFVSSLGYYIGYHYFIDKTGKITQGRSDLDRGAHCIGENETSLGICLAGNFDLTMPTTEQVNSLKELVNRKLKEYSLDKKDIYPHRSFANKTCYGRNLSDVWVQSLIENQNSIPYPCVSEHDKIMEQDKQISRLQLLINSLKVFFKL